MSVNSTANALKNLDNISRTERQTREKKYRYNAFYEEELLRNNDEFPNRYVIKMPQNLCSILRVFSWVFR